MRPRGPATNRRMLSAPVLLVADLLHPVDDLAVEGLLNGDMRHRRRWAGTVPMFDAGGTPDDIAGTDLRDRAAPTLRPAQAGSDDQGLTQGMGVPGGACTWLEGDARATDA